MIKHLVLGVKQFKGEIEGKNFDMTKVFVAVPFSRKAENSRGYNSVEADFGTSDNFDKFKGMKFPCEIEMESENVLKGRLQVMEIYEIKLPLAGAVKA